MPQVERRRRRQLWPRAAQRQSPPGADRERATYRCRARRRLRGRPVRPGQPQRRGGARRSRRGARPTPMRCASSSSPKPRAPMSMRPRRPSGSRSRSASSSCSTRSLDADRAGASRSGAPPGSTIARIAALRDQRAAPRCPRIDAERQAALFRLATLTGRTPRGSARSGRRARDDAAARPADPGRRRRRAARAPPRRPRRRAPPRRRHRADRRRDGAISIRSITLGGSIGSTGDEPRRHLHRRAAALAARPAAQLVAQPVEPARARIAGGGGRHPGRARDLRRHRAERAGGDRDRAVHYARELDRRTALQAARDNAATAARITRARQREGRSTSSRCSTAERTFADAEAELALADAQIAGAQVDLFRALGGGWQVAAVPGP